MLSPLDSALADLLEPPSLTSRWYCDRSDCGGNPHDQWSRHARTNQRPPEGVWLVALWLAGRGFGKTRLAAEWVTDQIIRCNRRRVALVGRTPADVRMVMIEGESGLIACAPPGWRPTYRPTRRTLVWPNGAEAYTYSAEVPSQLRGPQHEIAWCDELSSWTDAPKGDRVDTAWNNLMLGLRLGDDPRCVVTTTPKPNPLTRQLAERPTTRVIRGSTYDNLGNLAPTFREQILTTYQGTRVGRQELDGELLVDVEGALWRLTQIDATRAQLTT